jgi:homoserine O-succinyltransferase/O-acetyltransferase
MIVRSENCGDCLANRLGDQGLDVIDESTALSRGMRIARIGLLNRMPDAAFKATEEQVFGAIASHQIDGLAVEPVLVKLDDDPQAKEGSSRAENFKRYTSFSDVKEKGLDGLFFTGDNLEIMAHAGFSSEKAKTPSQRKKWSDALEPEEVDYYKALTQVADWADGNVYSSTFSCLGAHFALWHKFGLSKEIAKKQIIGKEIAKKKIFGVYDHKIVLPVSPIVEGLPGKIKAPHSRWGDVPVEAVAEVDDIEVVAVSRKAGWLLLQAANTNGGLDFYLQAHPEYDRLDLHNEYVRDKNQGRSRPVGYYRPLQPAKPENARQSWAADARRLYGNWLEFINQGMLA